MGSQLMLIAIEIESVLEPDRVTLTFIITLRSAYQMPLPVRPFHNRHLSALLRNRCHSPHSTSEEVEVSALGKTSHDIPKPGHQIRSVPL